jgi:hypothetical protein
VPSAPGRRLRNFFKYRLAWAVAFWLCNQICALAQVPNINVGPDSGFALMDFAQMYLDQMNRHAEKSAHQKA